jgi:NADPH2:quinone reductase
VAVSGVNPTDWKARKQSKDSTDAEDLVPNYDGAGTVDAVGARVRGLSVGQRVWLWEVGWAGPNGTAQEYVVLPAWQAVPLPDNASFELGACLGVPAQTAQRCLTIADGGPGRLEAGMLAGRTVLVAGGAGAVGNATIQLARWAGATVITTVSGPEKGELAKAAGAHHIVNYRTATAIGEIREAAKGVVDIVVEVAPAVNAALNSTVVVNNGTVAVYGNDGGDEVILPVFKLIRRNIRYQFMALYTMSDAAKQRAIEDVSTAIEAGALKAGREFGLPLHHFPLERTEAAHDAVQAGAVGKVLVSIVPERLGGG